MRFRRSLMLLPLLAAPAVRALEVPLQRAADKASRKPLMVGFVDMDAVYQEFPETQKARKEFKAQADKLRAALLDKEEELADLREQLEVLSAAEGAPAVTASSAPAVSTSTVPAPRASSDSLDRKRRELEEQEALLARSRGEAAEALAEFERRRAAQIFGKLYKSLGQLATEKGVDIVLDKAALLYGEGGVDLTEELRRRVRGLPEGESLP